MNMQQKSDLAQINKRIETAPCQSHNNHNLVTEKIKLLDDMLNTLRIVRLTAKTNDYDFLSYLAEMAALEAQRELHQVEFDKLHS